MPYSVSEGSDSSFSCLVSWAKAPAASLLAIPTCAVELCNVYFAYLFVSELYVFHASVLRDLAGLPEGQH